MPADSGLPQASSAFDGRSWWQVVGRILASLVSGTSPERVTFRISEALSSLIPHDDLRLSLAPSVETWWLKQTGFEVHRFDLPESGDDDTVSALRWVAIHNKPLLRPDIRSDLRFRRDPHVIKEGRVSSVHVPLLCGQKPFGVLTVSSSDPDTYSQDSVVLLEWIIQRIGDPLLAFAERHRDRVSGRLPVGRRLTVSLDRTLEHILKQIQDRGYDRVRIYLYDRSTEELVGGAQVGIETYAGFQGVRLPIAEDPYSQRTLEGREAQLYRWDEDEPSGRLRLEIPNPKTHDWAELPLVVTEGDQDLIVGKISVDNNPTLRPLDIDALQGLMSLAESAALAIRNAQLYESKVMDAERSVRVSEAGLKQQQALLEISTAVQGMSRPEDLEDVLAVSLARMRDLGMPVDAVAIHRVIDAATSEIETYRCSVGGPLTTAERRTSPNLCRLWSDGGLYIEGDLEARDLEKGITAFRGKFGGLQVRSLLDSAFSLGVVSVHSCEPRAFDASDRELVVKMAEVISLGALRMGDLQEVYVARDALLESEERYREIVHSVPVCIHEIDLEGRITSMNPAGLRMMGVDSESEIVGMCYTDAVGDLDRGRIEVLLEEARNGKVSFFEFRSASGLDFESSFIPLRSDDGLVEKVMGMTQDVTEQRKATAALAKSENSHRVAVESIGGTPYSLDMERGAYDYVGAGVADLFGCSPADFTVAFLDSRIDQIAEIPDHEVRRPANPLHSNVWHVKEYHIDALDGEGRWIRDTYVFTLDKDGRAVASHGILQDVTAQKRAERDMVRVQRLSAAWELSAGISHNLNNLLTGILGPAELLMASTNDPDVTERASEIVRAGSRARDLIRQLYRSSTRPESVSESVYLRDVVSEAVRNARPRWRDQLEAAGITITVDVDIPVLPPVRASQQGLHDVLLNLIFNAVDAMPDGGKIHFSAVGSEERVVLKVSDTGQGMTESVKNRIFEPFFTTKTEIGTGLGLYTVYHTIESFGGTIEIDSEPGSGTAFVLTLQTTDEIADPRPDQNQPPSEATRSRILIVEDETFVQDYLVAALGGQHDLTIYDTPASALEKLRSDQPDIVVADLGLPGIPGNQFLAQAAEVVPLASRVLMTGWNLESGDDRLRHVDFYIQKPMDLHELYDAVRDAQQLKEERRNE